MIETIYILPPAQTSVALHPKSNRLSVEIIPLGSTPIYNVYVSNQLVDTTIGMKVNPVPLTAHAMLNFDYPVLKVTVAVLAGDVGTKVIMMEDR